MWKTLLIIGAAGTAGYVLGAIFGAPSGGAPGPPQEDVAPIARMARDVRLMCRDITPTLAQVERAYDDGRLSPTEIYSIGTGLNRLM